MFPEYRDLISKLKTQDHHFRRLFDEHNALDEKITEMEKREIPVPDDEIEMLKKRMGVAEPKYKIDVAVGDAVKITDGPFKDFDGKVNEVDEEKGRVKVLVSIFGRETPVELDFLQINKI